MAGWMAFFVMPPQQNNGVRLHRLEGSSMQMPFGPKLFEKNREQQQYLKMISISRANPGDEMCYKTNKE